MSIVKFGDIVREVKLNVDRDNNPYEFYVAGEHMDTEDLTIRCKGLFATDDVGPAFTRIFKKGQILYGSRRTYLKKVAVADFDGICSNTTFVLESKNEHVFCQKLLPFIMLTDSFTKWSISHSKGSTNPYILFSDLANYAFELPSLDEQRVLADKLWAAYEVKESYKNLLAQTDKLLHAQFEKMFGNLLTNSLNLPTQKMSEVAPEIPSSKEQSGQVWQLNLDMIESKSGKIISKVYIDKDDVSSSTTAFDATNVLYSKLRPNLNKVVVPDESGYCTTELLPLKPNAKLLDRVFLATLLRNEEFVQWAINHSAGTKMPRVSLSAFREFRIIIPPMEKQLEFVRIAEQAERTKASLNKGIEAIEAVIRSLIAEGTTKV